MIKKVKVGMSSQDVAALLGECNDITSMEDVLGIFKEKKDIFNKKTDSFSNALWIYTVSTGKYQIYIRDGEVDEIEFLEKTNII